jgi:hypothetical protein
MTFAVSCPKEIANVTLGIYGLGNEFTNSTLPHYMELVKLFCHLRYVDELYISGLVTGAW